jgi:hypothetical protein
VFIAAATAIEAGVDFPLLPDLQHEKYILQTRRAVIKHNANNELMKI